MACKRIYPLAVSFAVAALLLFVVGCDIPVEMMKAGGKFQEKAKQASNKPWHEKFHWHAEDYFADPNVIELCQAIEANDLETMQSLIDAGVNINARGKGNMTPLLWAFPDNKLDRFELLMKSGADPNVYIESDFGVPNAFQVGDSVTHMAARTYFDYFDVVFKNGGDVNLPSKIPGFFGQTPIFTLIRTGGPKVKSRVLLLIDYGADVNVTDEVGDTPANFAAGFFGQYEVCLTLLRAGAQPRVRLEHGLLDLTHTLAKSDNLLQVAGAKQKSDYQQLLKWLETNGSYVDEARQDLERRSNYSGTFLSGWKHKELRLMRMADAFKSRNNDDPGDDEKYERIKQEFQKVSGKNLDEYTLYKWVDVEFLDAKGERITINNRALINCYHYDVHLVAVKWNDAGEPLDTLFIDVQNGGMMNTKAHFGGMKAKQFRVLCTARVGSSPSVAGFKNRNPLPQGTILDNSDWLIITTNKDGSEIEGLNFSNSAEPSKK